ncbi:MAG: hypothetical protein ACPL1Z_06450 [Candidatus Bathyarchaeales archaeon]
MDKKCLHPLLLGMAVMLMIVSTTPAYAQQIPATVNIYAWTDKTTYNPGESGKLTVVIRNDRTDQDLILYNVTVVFPWFAYTGEKWEGNYTVTLSPPATLQKNGGVTKHVVDFTVPSDGRALCNSYEVSIRAAVDKAPYHYDGEALIYVKSTPFYVSLENVDKFITLFTVQVILVIICTIIIAAAIFLSARRPKAVWSEEEKAE